MSCWNFDEDDDMDFEKYLTTVQKLATQSDQDSNEELLNLIQRYLTENQSDNSLREFFKGEYEFYSKRYPKALEHYLESKSVKQFEFYCYRAAAFISKSHGYPEKALAFAKKALMIYPEDYLTLGILKATSADHEALPKISLGERELEELTEIFEQKSGKEDSCVNEHPQAKNLEATMNNDASLFSFPRSSDPAVTSALTQRLYPIASEDSQFKTSSTPLNDIKKEILQSNETDSHFHLSPYSLTDEQPLENRIAFFQNVQTEKLIAYREQMKHRRPLPDNFLMVLLGAKNREASSTFPLCTEDSLKASGGYFLRWNKKGIVINPGKGFMHHFHSHGWHIKDIDFVIVTQDHPDTYADIHEIYELNYQLNRISQQELQVIHYYLNQNAYQDLSAKLKPNYKQERHTVHYLELFLDSPEIEKINLTDEIHLCYFPLSPIETSTHPQERLQKKPSALGLRLELKWPNEKKSIHLAYLSGASWSPLMGHYLERCDILIAGFGNTHPNDYNRISYTEGCLGYNGCSSLFEELTPKLMLCTEFGGREGDISLEVVKKMRQDISKNISEGSSHPCNILPGDIGFLVDLHHLKVRCSLSESFVDSEKVHVVKSSSVFSRFHYLAPESYL